VNSPTTGKQLRVLHCPVNTAGIPWSYVQALRRKGVDARLLVFDRGRLHPEADIVLNRPPGLVGRLATQSRAQLALLGETDIFHFYFGLTLVPKTIQFPLLRLAGKRSIYHFLGSDIRGKTPRQLRYAFRADAQLVGNYDDLRWLPESEVVFPGINLVEYQPHPPSERKRPLIVHAPSNRGKKGTAEVIQACELLNADLEIVEGLPHQQARARYEAADIIIDQLRVGWYGVFAIEAMALGKPVVCYLHQDALEMTEQHLAVRPPLVSATAGTLIQALQPLVESTSERRRVGAASRAYVEQAHDVDKIADQLIHTYSRLMA
jgi:hypothetical protein